MRSTSLKLVLGIFLISAFVLPSLAEVAPLIQTHWRNYTWPYNAHYPEEPEGLNGHIGNACGPTSISHILKYYEFPVQGYGSLTFESSSGHTWSADYANTQYEWEKMPIYLAPDATEDEYDPTAELVYHAAVSMHDVYGSGRNLEAIAEGLNLYLGYTDSAEVKNRWEHTLEEWNQFFYDELDAGRPILVCGRTEDSPAPWEPGNYQGHYWICDGYNDDGQFHLVYGYGDYDYYYDQDNFGAHPAYNSILTGLKPAYLGGTVAFDEALDGQYVQAGEAIDIYWENSGDVEEIRLVFSNSNSPEWFTIAENLDATDGSYSWTVPDTLNGTLALRIHDQDEINIYDAASIHIYSTIEVELLQPNGGEYFQSGSVVPVYFEVNGSPTVSVSYSPDNGTNWHTIAEAVDIASGGVDWTVPDTQGNEYLIRVLADLDGVSADTSSSTFVVGSEENIGGPYVTDENTKLYLDFNGDAENNGTATQDGSSFGAATYELGGLNGNGKSIRFENTLNVNGSCVRISSDGCINPDGSWTVEGWIKAASIGNEVCTYPIVFMLPGEGQFFEAPIWISIDNDRHALVARCFTTTGNGPSLSLPENSLHTDLWYHVAFIRDIENNELRLVVHDSDRELLHNTSQSFSSSISLASSEQSFHIGGVSSSSNMQFDGWVDEFRVSNIVRTFENPSDLDEPVRLKNVPDEFVLLKTYPNPFNPSTTASVSLPSTSHLILNVFNVNGQCVATLADGKFEAGLHSFVFDGQAMASGIYFIHASIPGELKQVNRVILIK